MAIQDKQQNGHIEDDLFISPKSKGERLKRLRHLANLSREEFCEDTEITLATLISWEVGRFGGLSAKGAARAITRLAKEGVFCTPEWLLYEIGNGPEVKVDFKKSQSHQETILIESVIPEKTAILEELLLFRKLNKNSIDYIIDDDAMLPHYYVGDYVAGIKRFGDKIKSLISLDCIVQIDDGRLMMRNLQAGPKENSFNLISTNLQTKSKYSIMYDVHIVVAAPILWHRRQDPAL